MSEHQHTHGPANRRRRVVRTSAPLFVVEPTGPARRGVIVLHDQHGLTERVERHCRRLAGEGALVVAPYHYYERGGPEYPDSAEAAAAWRALHPDDLHANVEGARQYLTHRRGIPADAVSVLPS